MLRNKADRKSVAYIIGITLLLVVQWALTGFHWPLIALGCWMAVPVSVMAHNHNHVNMWRSKPLNKLTDYWITLFYGFPAFAWIPTHNMNHHKYNNRPQDDTRTYRYTEANNLLTLMTYPSISGAHQQKAIRTFIKSLWSSNRERALYYLSQLAMLIVFVGVALFVDWKKALLFIVLPQQVSLYAVLIFNYVQHIHADEKSEWFHSRDFVGWGLNTFLFNNGYHTVHHHQPGMHWSDAPKAHAKIAHNLHPDLQEKSFLGFLFRCYIVSIVFPSLRTRSLRLARIATEKREPTALAA